jgi:hypothetical protein
VLKVALSSLPIISHACAKAKKRGENGALLALIACVVLL